MDKFRHPNESLQAQADTYQEELAALALLALGREIESESFVYQVSQLVIAAYMTAFLLGGGDVNEWDGDEMLSQRQQAIRSVYRLSDDIYGGAYDAIDGERTAEQGRTRLMQRLVLWGFTLGLIYSVGQLFPRFRMIDGALGEPNYVWRRGGTKEPCDTCLMLDGVVMSAAEWRASGYRPQGSSLECGGWNCLCYLEPTTEPSRAGEVLGWTVA